MRKDLLFVNAPRLLIQNVESVHRRPKLIVNGPKVVIGLEDKKELSVYLIQNLANVSMVVHCVLLELLLLLKGSWSSQPGFCLMFVFLLHYIFVSSIGDHRCEELKVVNAKGFGGFFQQVVVLIKDSSPKSSVGHPDLGLQFCINPVIQQNELSLSIFSFPDMNVPWVGICMHKPMLENQLIEDV